MVIDERDCRECNHYIGHKCYSPSASKIGANISLMEDCPEKENDNENN